MAILEICNKNCELLFIDEPDSSLSGWSLIQPEGPWISDEGTLEQFLSAENQPSTFFQPEPRAGPDIVCILKQGDRRIAVFIQAKLALDVNYKTAMTTTDSRQFFYGRTEATRSQISRSGLKKNEAVKEALANYEAELGIIVSFPYSFPDFNTSSRPSPNRFERIFDRRNIHKIIGEEYTPESYPEENTSIAHHTGPASR